MCMIGTAGKMGCRKEFGVQVAYSEQDMGI